MRFLLIVLMSVFSAQTFAFQVPARLKKLAAEKKLAIGSFVLEKEIPDIGVSVKSIGVFRFEHGVGITWKNLSPNEFTFFASDKFYEISSKSGTKKHSIENFGAENPALMLLNGDFSDLEDKFNLETLKDEGGETIIKLLPKISKIKNGLISATLCFGKSGLEKCRLELANGTVIKIEFKETL
ncbi:MAG: outer-membrane lipoprotein carrier protein LolA [Opitutales bacterium]|nr:outer-membrane lipoprotein carrier protein LolA [Opitutales bacterium]